MKAYCYVNATNKMWEEIFGKAVYYWAKLTP